MRRSSSLWQKSHFDRSLTVAARKLLILPCRARKQAVPFRESRLLLRTARFRILIAALLVVCLWTPLAGAQFIIEPVGAPPSEGVGEKMRGSLDSKGVRVKGPGGKVVAEYWARSAEFSGPPVSGFGIRFESIPEGALLALVRFPEKSSGFREQTIPAGMYTMRFGLHPENGDHMGVAPSRDFALLTPVADDPDPAKNYGYDELVAMSKKVGNPHPTIARVELPAGDQAPHIRQNDYQHWVLDLKVAGQVVGIVVHGHAEE